MFGVIGPFHSVTVRKGRGDWCAPAPVMGSVSGAVEALWSRTDIALSFAPVTRAAAPGVVDLDTREQQGRAAANPFSWDPFCRIFFPECGGASPNDVPENPLKRPLPWRSKAERAGRKLAVVIGG